jgi:EAL domain-containing protein (putative c-di-GMP-specific phosphodiesterase class I)
MIASDPIRAIDERGGEVAGVGDDAADLEFAALLDQRDLHMVFQPLVNLKSGEIVALEALARGPESTRLASPLALFEAARRANRVAELDWACRAAAFRTFLEADAPTAISLFVNVEPEAIASACPADLVQVVSKAESRLRVFVEINDLALAADPAGVLAAVDRAREMGWGIAIDDVGNSRAPIAMLPIVGADVVKLDLRRLDAASDEDSSAIISSVLRHVERTGAALLVEGIESRDDARWARALGAVYGQGHHLGKPGPLLAKYANPRAPIPLIKVVPTDLQVASPFELFEGGPHEKASGTHLDKLAGVLAYGPRPNGTRCVFLACFGRAGEIPAELLEHGTPEGALLFVAFGTGLAAEPFPGVRGVRLVEDDPFADEKFLIVLSDQAPVAIFARASSNGLYDVVVTQDFELVHEIARHLIRRVPGPGRNNNALGGSEREDKSADEEEVSPGLTPKRGWRGWRSART